MERPGDRAAFLLSHFPAPAPGRSGCGKPARHLLRSGHAEIDATCQFVTRISAA